MTQIPKIDGRLFRPLCLNSEKPNQLAGFFQLWLVQHFANPDNIIQPNLRSYIWDQDPELSKIQILQLTDWRPQTTEQRPALIIKRQALKFNRLGIDNRFMGGGQGPLETRTIYAGSFQGSHSIFCIANEASEAESLGTEVYNELMKFAPIMRKWLNLLRIELVGISEISKLEEARENFAVIIDIAYAYGDQWEVLALDDPLITNIKLLLS